MNAILLLHANDIPTDGLFDSLCMHAALQWFNTIIAAAFPTELNWVIAQSVMLLIPPLWIILQSLLFVGHKKDQARHHSSKNTFR